jgi:hypothetical protein
MYIPAQCTKVLFHLTLQIDTLKEFRGVAITGVSTEIIGQGKARYSLWHRYSFLTEEKALIS